jgi:hypothetical protein
VRMQLGTSGRLWHSVRGGPSGSGELSPGGGSTEMRSDTSRKFLPNRVDEHLQPMVQLKGLWRPDLPVAAQAPQTVLLTTWSSLRSLSD